MGVEPRDEKRTDNPKGKKRLCDGLHLIDTGIASILFGEMWNVRGMHVVGALHSIIHSLLQKFLLESYAHNESLRNATHFVSSPPVLKKYKHSLNFK